MGHHHSHPTLCTLRIRELLLSSKAPALEGGQRMPVQWGLCKNPSAIWPCPACKKCGPRSLMRAACQPPRTHAATMQVAAGERRQAGDSPTVSRLPEVVQCEASRQSRSTSAISITHMAEEAGDDLYTGFSRAGPLRGSYNSRNNTRNDMETK